MTDQKRIAAARKIAELVTKTEKQTVDVWAVMRQAEAGGYLKYAIDLQLALDASEERVKRGEELLRYNLQWIPQEGRAAVESYLKETR